MKFKEGKQYECTHSESPGYKLGQHYLCYKNADNYLCLRGSDGYEDLTVMLLSKFKQVEQ